MKAQLLWEHSGELLEGPIWDEESKQLVFVDIKQQQLLFLEPETRQIKKFPFSHPVTSVGKVNGQEWLISTGNELVIFDTKREQSRKIAAIPAKKWMRFNDGKCDPFGRYWIGSMCEGNETEVASLYVLSDKNNLIEARVGMTISNGLAWNEELSLMYFIDTPTQKVFAQTFNQETVSLREAESVIDLSSEKGYPDGMTIDASGDLWISMWGGGTVLCVNPQKGEVIDRIEVEADQVTSCTFGGPNYDTLFITTARIGLSDESLMEKPLAGSVFLCEMPVKGKPLNKVSVGV
ncbi:SMP-30/gluconolactonase/LRE family protein [Alkalihalobacillus sp. 1P02AB]|uniref:SMP-30/gluconolactonase/LRE family protein n=1 Tax=Alkalihalobacillus sp. 1P02AB TaxID=3132260 RepID=UPI0039A719D3